MENYYEQDVFFTRLQREQEEGTLDEVIKQRIEDFKETLLNLDLTY